VRQAAARAGAEQPRALGRLPPARVTRPGAGRDGHGTPLFVLGRITLAALPSTPLAADDGINPVYSVDLDLDGASDLVVASERLVGTPGDDEIAGFDGNDRLDGDGGIDLARYAARRAEAHVVKTADGWSVSSAADGSDVLTGVERLRFADTHVALDLAGHAGSVAKILGALFGKASLANAVYAGIGLSLLDSGMSYADLVTPAVSSDAFVQLAGGRTHGQFVDLVYRNVVGSAPDALQRGHFVGLLERGEQTQASLALLAAETALNAQQIEMAALALVGLPYEPFGT
jgi:hypothetical protein